jgi:hypothetical protein
MRQTQYHPSNRSSRTLLGGMLLAVAAVLALPSAPASASPLIGPVVRPGQVAPADALVTPVVVVRRGVAVRGPRGGRYVRGRTVVRPGVRGYGARGYGYRGYGYRGPAVVGWRRPGNYWWGPGAAIAAGAAIGVVGAAAATSWAGQPPAPGYCWYYSDPSRRQGFWDVCPQ